MSLLRVPPVLSSLDPHQLLVHRSTRYDGSGVSVPLARLGPTDAAAAQQLYADLRRVSDLWYYMDETPHFGLLEQELRRLQAAPRSSRSPVKGPAAGGDVAVAESLHDVRAGALSALFSLLDLLCAGREPFTRDDVIRCIRLVLDHAKMMRNAIEDLDSTLRSADERRVVHSVHGSYIKWRDTRFFQDGQPVEVSARRACDGFWSCRCLETAAVDRVTYNLLNYSAGHALDRRLSFEVVGVTEELVRWIVSHSSSAPASAAWSWADYQACDDLGFVIGAELVSRCFGLVNPEQAVEQHYLGVSVEEGRLTSWFHWPRYQPQPSDQVCTCMDEPELEKQAD